MIRLSIASSVLLGQGKRAQERVHNRALKEVGALSALSLTTHLTSFRTQQTLVDPISSALKCPAGCSSIFRPSSTKAADLGAHSLTDRRRCMTASWDSGASAVDGAVNNDTSVACGATTALTLAESYRPRRYLVEESRQFTVKLAACDRAGVETLTAMKTWRVGAPRTICAAFPGGTKRAEMTGDRLSLRSGDHPTF